MGISWPCLKPKEHHGGEAGPIIPVPRGIRPTLAKYRLEVVLVKRLQSL